MSTYDEFSRAKYAAFFYLGRNALTEHQLREKLQRKEYSPEIIDKTLKYMLELGYINDRDYAERYTKDAVNLKKHGMMRIKLDLRRKGIDSDLIDEVLEELEIDTTDALNHLIEKKSAGLDLKDRKHKARLVNFLLRRGYKYDEINTVLREMEEIDFD